MHVFEVYSPSDLMTDINPFSERSTLHHSTAPLPTIASIASRPPEKNERLHQHGTKCYPSTLLIERKGAQIRQCRSPMAKVSSRILNTIPTKEKIRSNMSLIARRCSSRMT
jgi:hypothetical protein